MAALRPVGPVPIMAEQCSVRSPRGVVAAAAPVAARIGASMLAAGGNAYDAAVAAALAETVLLPPKCGISGDLVALVWPQSDAQPTALLAIGGAPGGLADVASRGDLEATGPMAVGVPGAPAGYAALAERGVLGLPALVAPAVECARNGFVWSRICGLLGQESSDLVRAHNPEGTVYLPQGEPLTDGDVVSLPGLADALELFASDAEGFLAGPVGAAIVARVSAAGGVLSTDDMRFARATWEAPAQTKASLGQYFATPAPTHGPSLLAVIDRLEGKPGHQGDVYEAVMAAINDRRDSLADPSGTSMVSAIDNDRTMVSVVHSNSFPRFGSGLVVPEFDLILANRAGRGFSDSTGHPNFPVAGRRPATTLHAWALRGQDDRRLQGATPGGSNQMPWNAQALTRLQHAPDEIAEAVVDARWEWLPGDDGVRIEEGVSADDAAALEKLAPSVDHVNRWGLRSAMQIIADDGHKKPLLAVVDPRTGGGVTAL